MLEMIDSPGDVIALRLAGRITGEELDTVMDRLEGIMARHKTVHVFVETHHIEAFSFSGLRTYLKRALPLFGKLTHFGRVAVVADQAWVRMATRVESVMVPFVHYRSFIPNRRNEALAWVTGQGI